MDDVPYSVVPYLSRQTWLEARYDGVGGSDASATIHINPWSTELGLYLAKIQRRSIMEDENLDEMLEWGNRHELAIIQAFVDKADAGVHKILRNQWAIYWSVDHPHRFCTPDALIYHKDGHPIALLEVKCAWYDSAKSWQTKCPLNYQCQVQYSLDILGLDVAYFAVLLNGYQFKWFRMTRNDRFIAYLNRHVDAFWRRVQYRNPPPVTASRLDTRALSQLHPDDNGAAVELDKELTLAHERREAALAEAKKQQAIADRESNRIREAIAENSYGVLPGGDGYSWLTNAKGVRTFRRVPRQIKVENNGE